MFLRIWVFFFERSTIESKKIRHVPAKSIVTTVALWSSKSRRKLSNSFKSEAAQNNC